MGFSGFLVIFMGGFNFRSNNDILLLYLYFLYIICIFEIFCLNLLTTGNFYGNLHSQYVHLFHAIPLLSNLRRDQRFIFN